MIRAQGTPAGGRWRFGAIVGRVLGLALLVGVVGHVAPAWAQDELFVTNQDSNSVTVYFRTADGDVTPVRTLSEGLTGLSDPSGLFVDTVNNELFVANLGNDSVTVYSRTASGDTGPTRTLSGGDTDLSDPQFVFVTASAPIPTLSEWGQIGMAALLVLGGLLALRRSSGQALRSFDRTQDRLHSGRSGRGTRLHTPS